MFLMTGLIKIKQLTAKTTIGVHNLEQQILSKVILDLDIAIDTKSIAQHDNIEQTLNYHSLAYELTQWLEKQKYYLLDTLIEKTAEYLITKYAISYLKLSMSKPKIVDNTESVTICIERRAEDYSTN